MAKINSIALTATEHLALENGWHRGKSIPFRQRCRIVLLKSEARTSKDVAAQVGCCEPVVNAWFARYKAQGLEGLRTQPGQGRRAILQSETDLAAVRRAVQDNRQRVSLAKAELERELGKQFSALTLRRFLKKMDAASSCVRLAHPVATSASDGG
jgi:transposase